MKKILQNERGAIFPLMLFFTFVFIALGTLVLTVGHSMFARHLAQNAVDASSLAAASMVTVQDIYTNPWDPTPAETRIVIDPVEARSEAESYFNQNASVLRLIAHTVTPSYIPVSDRQYRVECDVVLRPLFGDSDMSFQVRAEAEVTP